MAETIHVRLIRSPIGTQQRVRQTLKGLGLGKVGSSSTVPKTPAVLGMLRRVSHLVSPSARKGLNSWPKLMIDETQRA
jgi:large subunit ribosomal protein L30